MLCILYPGSNLFVVAGTAEQGAKIATDKLTELSTLLPRLKQEIKLNNKGEIFSSEKDSCKVTFKNGSTFELIAALNSNRGRRKTGGLIEECVYVNGDILSQVIIPMLNVSRRVNGKVDPKEIHKRQLYVTSAGYKNSFSYNKLLQILIWQAIKDDNTACCIGGSWELAVKIGLLEKNFVNELKEDGTYSEESFEREYGSVWSGTVDGSFFNADKFDKLRVLTTPIMSSDLENNMNTDIYYVISVDVGRLNDRTEVCIFKVTPGQDNKSIKSLVNIKTYESEHFETQSLYIKELVDRYNAKMLIVDGNGAGVGLVDYLVKPTHMITSSDYYPPYSVVNDSRYDSFKTDESIPKLYVIKGNKELNNSIIMNVVTQMETERVRFLISEKAAKATLLEEEIKNKKHYTSLYKMEKLKPHMYTTSLKEEMMNLRRRNNINSTSETVALEQVNKKMHDDKFMAFAYGLYWIKLQDDTRFKNKKHNNLKNMIFYTKGKW